MPVLVAYSVDIQARQVLTTKCSSHKILYIKLIERLTGSQEVRGSIPLISTKTVCKLMQNPVNLMFTGFLVFTNVTKGSLSGESDYLYLLFRGTSIYIEK